MGHNGINYFKRFKSEVQKKDSELFKNSKYYNKSLHNIVDFLSEYNREKRSEQKISAIFEDFDLESQVKLYCPICSHSNEYKEFCFSNLMASIQSGKESSEPKKNIKMLKQLYYSSKCSSAFTDFDQDFVEFGVA